jgi:hypothetical protein
MYSMGTSPVSIVWWRNMFMRYGQGCMVFMMLVLVIGFGWNQFGSHPNGPQTTNPDKVVMTVNGTPETQQDYLRAAGQLRESSPGPDFAKAQGQALQSLVQQAVIKQMAQKRGVTAQAADVDRQMDQLREQAGKKNASDSDWEDWLAQRTGLTVSDYREQLANSAQTLFPALLNSYKANEHVTDQDVKNQNAQVKLDVIVIPSGPSRFGMPLKTRPMTDAEAKAKAESLLAQVRKGADFAALAKANSSDPSSRNGGLLEYRPEYRTQPGGMGDMMGSLGYGKEFDEAVHKTAVGQITDVFKSSGFTPGYVFAKVVDRRVNTPKDYDPRKAMDQLKTQLAQAKLQDDFQKLFKAANVKVLDPEKKPYYDYAKLQELNQPDFQAIMAGKPQDPARQVEATKQQALVDTEFEGLLKQHPDDPTAALIVADAIKTRKMFAPGTTPAQRTAYQDQLIQIYQKVLKSTEDRTLRFDLADLYVEKKDYAKANEEYGRIMKYLGEDPPYNGQTYDEYKGFYDRLATDFARINQPQQAAEARSLAAKMQADGAVAKAREAAEQKAQQGTQPGGLQVTPGKSITLPPGGRVSVPGKSISLPPGGRLTVPGRPTTMPPSGASGGNATPPPSATTGGATAPPSAPSGPAPTPKP